MTEFDEERTEKQSLRIHCLFAGQDFYLVLTAGCLWCCFNPGVVLRFWLAAFEDMLENPLNSTQWMNDPETGPVMLQISRIFQTLNRT